MPYKINPRRSGRKTRREVNVHQNKFDKAYISTIANSRRPLTSLSDMTNMEVVQDYVVRPRPPMVEYGTQPPYPVIGRAMVRYGGSRKIYWMLNVAGVGKIYRQTDGGAFTLVGGTYTATADYMGGVQANGKLYIYNGTDNLSYVDLSDNSVNTYTGLATPVITTVAKTGMAGTTYTHYYRVTANNAVGESIASATGSVTSGKVRDNWILNTDYIDITITAAVTGATSYTYYYGDSPTTLNELYTVSGNATLTFRDLGDLAANPYKLAPEGDSTAGKAFTWMYVDSKNSQIFGITSDNYLYYSNPGSGDFSPYNGGGYYGIDVDGDTELNYVNGFRTGKGDPVITISLRGSAGKGKIMHLAFATLTVGDQVISYADVSEANGQAGTYSARGTVKARDSLWYFTGQEVKSTGTSQNVMNILTTTSVSQVLEPDLANVNISALSNSVGVEYKDRIYWALPVGSTTNNEIWYIDLSRKNLWVLRWPIPATDLWLYEDSNGTTHFCALVNGDILEFTRTGAQTHQDNGIPFTSNAGFSSLVWDEDGLSLAKIRNMYIKLLNVSGTVNADSTGLTRKGITQAVGSTSFTANQSPTGWNAWVYNEHQYNTDVGIIETYGKSVTVMKMKPRGLLNQLDWNVGADTAGSDFILSAVNTRGFALDQLTLKEG